MKEKSIELKARHTAPPNGSELNSHWPIQRGKVTVEKGKLFSVLNIIYFNLGSFFMLINDFNSMKFVNKKIIMIIIVKEKEYHLFIYDSYKKNFYFLF